MARKIAVAIIHGIGEQDENFALDMEESLRRYFNRAIHNYSDDPDAEMVVEAVWWARALSESEDRFYSLVTGETYDDEETFRTYLGDDDPDNFEAHYQNYVEELRKIRLSYMRLRAFVVRSGADVIAYQPIPGNRDTYDKIHDYVAEHLSVLADRAGEDAPLCIICHSLGTVVASNYLWDLQHHSAQKEMIDQKTLARLNTPLERAETLAHLYTLGSPLALWALRWSESKIPFGKPINFPGLELHSHYPNLKGEWINFYDRDDIIGYPLRPLNGLYRQMVTEDREVNVGSIMESWNPGSHLGYWTSKKVQQPIAESLAHTWRSINGKGS